MSRKKCESVPVTKGMQNEVLPLLGGLESICGQGYFLVPDLVAGFPVPFGFTLAASTAILFSCSNFCNPSSTIGTIADGSNSAGDEPTFDAPMPNFTYNPHIPS